MDIPKIAIHTANFAEVDMYPVRMWFSYSTMIAFLVAGRQLIKHRNDWGPTTGKHLNKVPGGEIYEDWLFRCLWHLYTCEKEKQVDDILATFGIPNDKETWLIICDKLDDEYLDITASTIRHIIA